MSEGSCLCEIQYCYPTRLGNDRLTHHKIRRWARCSVCKACRDCLWVQEGRRQKIDVDIRIVSRNRLVVFVDWSVVISVCGIDILCQDTAPKAEQYSLHPTHRCHHDCLFDSRSMGVEKDCKACAGIEETHTDENKKTYPDVQCRQWSEPRYIYRMMSTLGTTQVQLPMQSVTVTTLQGQDQDSPRPADRECGSVLISRRYRKDLSSSASIAHLATC